MCPRPLDQRSATSASATSCSGVSTPCGILERIIIGPYERLCGAFNAFDKTVVDATVNATGTGTEVASQVLKLFQTGSVRNYALFLFLGALALLWYLG